MSKAPKLFIPGPTHVSEDILEVFKTPQHEYTKHLINSEPSGEPDPFDET